MISILLLITPGYAFVAVLKSSGKNSNLALARKLSERFLKVLKTNRIISEKSEFMGNLD